MSTTKTYTLYILLLIAAGLSMLSSCSAGDESPAANESRVSLKFKVGSISMMTRATDKTEGGWNDGWNENLVSRLNLLMFNADGSFVRNIPFAGINCPDASSMQSIDVEKEKLTVAEVENAAKRILVANGPAAIDNFKGSLDDLKNITVGGNGFKPANRQSEFVMVDDSNGKITEDKANNNIILSFSNLKRVLSKIRIGFTGDTDVNSVSLRLVNYAPTAPLLNGGTPSMTGVALMSYPSTSETDYSQSTLLYTGNGSSPKIVLYSYPNDWFDADNFKPWNDEPIIAARQTYIMLREVYGGKNYSFKIPVNFRLPENNDDKNMNAEDYRHLYQLNRNTIYDVMLTIDHSTGTIKISDWQTGDNFFIDSDHFSDISSN